MEYTQLKSALAANIHAQTIAERDYKKAQTEAGKWERRYQLSLKEGREDLVREARFRKDVSAKTACNLKALLNEQTERLATLRHDLAAQSKTLTNKSSTNSGFNSLEKTLAELPGSDLGTRLLKIECELEAMKTQLLHQQAGIGKLLQQNSTILDNVKTLLVETSSDATSEPNSTDLETQWLSIESDNDIDDELAALRTLVCYSATSQNQTQLPTIDTVSQIAEVDDLEILRSQLDEL
jgi:phage shock protein A